METRDYFRLEEECEFRFCKQGTCYHLCTDENCPVIFHNEDEFKIAMNLVALLSVVVPSVKILTFEIMSNHMHFALCGKLECIQSWFDKLVLILKTNPELAESRDTIASLKAKMIAVDGLENLRNVIAYINRNGFVVNYGCTPYSYPWGANRFFFNPEAKARYDISKTKATMRCKRKMFHSNLADNISEIYVVDGFVSPLCFCKIDLAESFFRSAQHYFAKISRSIESSATIAKEIGESLYYLDTELYSIVAMKSSKEFGCKSPAQLPSAAKITVAKMMRYDYNASAKQIARILKMDIGAVRRLFPGI